MILHIFSTDTSLRERAIRAHALLRFVKCCLQAIRCAALSQRVALSCGAFETVFGFKHFYFITTVDKCTSIVFMVLY